MENTLKLVGKNSNEIFTLRYPTTLLDFSEFDFSYYAGAAIDICNEALKSGTPDFDKISDIKKDIQSAHCFLQYSTRTTYDKIVFDCWIDYVCRRDNIGNSALWNRFIRCKTPFEKIIFQRLCDFRYKRAVNEWLNVIRLQDYAKAKMEFVFSEEMKSPQEAEERRNYFDLMFSVTARELGCRLEDLGVTKYYSMCRTPGSPFMFPNISKEIIRHVLAGFDYSDDYSDIEDYTESADEIAMDAFSRMRAGLPPELSTYKIPAGKFENMAEKIYMPCGLKAAIDLEIDAIIESGMWLARCKRCGRFFPKSKDAAEDYCTRRSIPAGKTCLEIYEEANPRPKISDELLERCKLVTDEMYSRVDKTMSPHEYNSWYTYLEAMKQKVENGEIASSELENFLEYSREVDISKSNPIVEVAKKEPEAPKERVVKPFIPERISRSEIKQYEAPVEPEEPVTPAPKPSREGFFTSPSVQRQKNERPQISHIIRNGESLGRENQAAPNPAGFQPFEAQFTQPRTREQPVPQPAPQPEQRPARKENDAYENFKRLEERLEAERRLREERNTFKPLAEPDRGGFVEDYPQTPPRREPPRTVREEPRRYSEPEEPYYNKPDERYEEPRPTRRIAEEAVPVTQPERREMRDRRVEQYGYREEEDNRQLEPPQIQPKQPEPPEQPEQPAEQRPRVIRKNAAAISAYGKMAGKPVSTMNSAETAPSPSEEAVSRPSADYEQPPHRYEREAEPTVPQLDSEMLEPFKDIGSIFDVLEQSESTLNAVGRSDELSRERYEDRGAERSPELSRERYVDRGAERSPEPSRERYVDRGAERIPEPSRERYVDRGAERSPDYAERIPPEPPRTIKNDEVPSGIWTEDRGLFGNAAEPSPVPAATRERNIPEQEPEEPDTAREKRHTRSSKTQRLYDVIMREPDDNPNFRRKK